MFWWERRSKYWAPGGGLGLGFRHAAVESERERNRNVCDGPVGGRRQHAGAPVFGTSPVRRPGWHPGLPRLRAGWRVDSTRLHCPCQPVSVGKRIESLSRWLGLSGTGRASAPKIHARDLVRYPPNPPQSLERPLRVRRGVASPGRSARNRTPVGSRIGGLASPLSGWRPPAVAGSTT